MCMQCVCWTARSIARMEVLFPSLPKKNIFIFFLYQGASVMSKYIFLYFFQTEIYYIYIFSRQKYFSIHNIFQTDYGIFLTNAFPLDSYSYMGVFPILNRLWRLLNRNDKRTILTMHRCYFGNAPITMLILDIIHDADTTDCAQDKPPKTSQNWHWFVLDIRINHSCLPNSCHIGYQFGIL